MEIHRPICVAGNGLSVITSVEIRRAVDNSRTSSDRDLTVAEPRIATAGFHALKIVSCVRRERYRSDEARVLILARSAAGHRDSR